MKIVFFVILAFLAIVGISHIIFEFFYHFSKVKNDNTTLLYIPDPKNTADIEFSLRSVIAKSKKLGKNYVSNIVCINDKLDEDFKLQLNILKSECEYLEIMSFKDFIKKAGL
ncbi:MAG: hypothetical protein IKB73_06785 [Ruminococcus sp.]|nr:hypothetical protein [Ruminococcus sp.]